MKCVAGWVSCQGPYAPPNQDVCSDCACYHDENPNPRCPCNECKAEREFKRLTPAQQKMIRAAQEAETEAAGRPRNVEVLPGELRTAKSLVTQGYITLQDKYGHEYQLTSKGRTLSRGTK